MTGGGRQMTGKTFVFVYIRGTTAQVHTGTIDPYIHQHQLLTVQVAGGALAWHGLADWYQTSNFAAHAPTEI